MSRQRRKPRPAEPKFVLALAHFNGFCGLCSASVVSEDADLKKAAARFSIGDRIYWCPKTETTPTMRVHESCYLLQMGLYGPSDPSRPTVRVGPTGRGFTPVRTVRRKSRHIQKLTREQRTR
jgi:hypothetical protein